MTEENYLKALQFAESHPASAVDFSGDEISFGRAEDLTDSEHEELLVHLKNLSPWRKGPFNIFGHRIDANWKSEKKWNRILPWLDPMEDRVIADIGCNNGYYMFRMAHFKPSRILGVDPVVHFERKHEFFRKLYLIPEIEFKKTGFEEMYNCEMQFDMLFAMGILYHHTDPMDILRSARHALKKDGQFVCETLGYLPASISQYYDVNSLTGGDIFEKSKSSPDMENELLSAEESLIPRKRYSGMKSVWNVPSPGAVRNWLARAGFRSIELICAHRYEQEQLKTPWCSMPGLSEFLHPSDKNKTVEGYPAPLRFIFTARR